MGMTTRTTRKVLAAVAIASLAFSQLGATASAVTVFQNTNPFSCTAGSSQRLRSNLYANGPQHFHAAGQIYNVYSNPVTRSNNSSGSAWSSNVRWGNIWSFGYFKLDITGNWVAGSGGSINCYIP